MVGISFNTDSSFKTEVVYFLAGLLLFSAGQLLQRGVKRQ